MRLKVVMLIAPAKLLLLRVTLVLWKFNVATKFTTGNKSAFLR